MTFVTFLKGNVMFYYLCGKLAVLDSNLCVIDCGGVGYKLYVSLITAESLTTKIGTEVKLFTHLSVREDGVELFGFGSSEERNTFNMLIEVSGVGPKAAMNILSVMTPENLAIAVANDDIKSISKAPNIGSKTAARIILELRDKVAKNLLPTGRSSKSSPSGNSFGIKSGNLSEAAEGLMVLGYDKNSVLNALAGIDPTLDAGSIIKAALKKLAK